MLVVTLVAITCRAAIPAGYMLDTQNGGLFEMVICTANGQETILVDQNLNPVLDTEKHTSSQIPHDNNTLCDFALNTQYFAVSDIPTITVTANLYGVLQLPAAIIAFRYPVFFGNSGTRAPPLFYV